MNIPYTSETLSKAVKTSKSYSEVLYKLGKMKSGSAFTSLKNNIVKFKIDISHFPPVSKRGGMLSNGNFRKKKASDILVLKDTSWKETGARLTRALLEIGRKHICQECSIGNVWNNKPITLEVDHIDGNNKNNIATNLRFVCPNCHSQFPTSKNIKQKRPSKYCKCGNVINKLSISCSQCTRVLQGIKFRKATRPSLDILKKEIEELGYCGVGRKYGVSDNAIRKWLK